MQTIGLRIPPLGVAISFNRAFARHVKRFGGSGSRIQADCLYRFDEPVSPHLAAKLSLGAEHEVRLHVSVDC